MTSRCEAMSLVLRSRRHRATLRCTAAAGEQQATKKAAFADQSEEVTADEDVGEVEKILGSRVVDRETQYLIQWKDDHPDSWEPRENISQGLLEDYEQPWWIAAKKGDDAKLKELLLEGRNPDAVDDKNRTALFFAAGFGNDKCVELLIEAGSDVLWQDEEGYTPLHMASGYVQPGCVKLLLEAGADPEIEDNQKRSSLFLAKDLLEKTPQNPLTLGRRITLDQVVKMLDDAVFEEVEVQQVLDRRIGEGGVIEYLVRWSDESEDSWEPGENIGEDLVKDFEQGLEYGVAEMILEKRGGDAGVEYLVKWADSEENTWEPAENIAEDVIADFEGRSNGEGSEERKAAGSGAQEKAVAS